MAAPPRAATISGCRSDAAVTTEPFRRLSTIGMAVPARSPGDDVRDLDQHDRAGEQMHAKGHRKHPPAADGRQTGYGNYVEPDRDREEDHQRDDPAAARCMRARAGVTHKKSRRVPTAS